MPCIVCAVESYIIGYLVAVHRFLKICELIKIETSQLASEFMVSKWIFQSV